MQASSLIALLVGAALGLGIQAMLGRGRLAALERSERRSTAMQERLETAEADRMVLRDQSLELQRAMRAERSLLDGVAARSGIAPHDFRRALARDVLHPADPSRQSYEREPLEMVDQLAVADSSAGVSTRGALDLARSELTERTAELTERTAELAERTAELADARSDAETLAGLLAANRRATAGDGTIVAGSYGLFGRRHRPQDAQHWSDVSQRLASLQGEVASLRSQIADRALAGDRSAVRQAELDRLLDHVVDELERLRHHVQASRDQE